MELIQQYVPIILGAIGLFATISRFTPNKTDDKIAGFLLKFVNLLGLKDKSGGSGVGSKK